MIRVPRELAVPAVLAVAAITGAVLYEHLHHGDHDPTDGSGSGGPQPVPPTPAPTPSPAPAPAPAPSVPGSPQPPHGNTLPAGIYWNDLGSGPSLSRWIAEPHGELPAEAGDDNRAAVQHIYQAWGILSDALDDPAVTDQAGRLGIELNMTDAPAIDQYGNVDVPQHNVYADRDHDLTSELMPVDVAIHELTHRVQTTAYGINVGIQSMDLEQRAVLEGTADAAAMVLTRDWKIGEGYITPASNHQSIRNAATSIDDDYVSGVATDYRDVAAKLQVENTDGAALQQLIQQFDDYDTQVRAGGRTPMPDEVYREQQMQGAIETATAALSTRTNPYNSDEHEYGSIIPRAFREFQLRAGWDASEQVVRAILLDHTLWNAQDPPNIADVFSAMRRAVADAPGAEQEEMDAALDAVHAPPSGDTAARLTRTTPGRTAS